jgi:hypothetical protein
LNSVAVVVATVDLAADTNVHQTPTTNQVLVENVVVAPGEG